MSGAGHIVEAGALLRLLGCSGVGGGDFHPRFGRQLFHCVHEGHAPLIGHPANGIAMRLAAKAVVEVLLVIDVEAGRFLVVERTARLKLTPSLGQPKGTADHCGQRGPHAQFVKPLGRQGHEVSDLTRAPPRPLARAGALHRLFFCREGAGSNGLIAIDLKEIRFGGALRWRSGLPPERHCAARFPT